MRRPSFLALSHAVIACAALLAFQGGVAAAQPHTVEPHAVQSNPGRTGSVGPLPKPAVEGGYLAPDRTPDAVPLLGPPPPDGSGTKLGDIATYRATRALLDKPRGRLATRDAVYGADALMQDFACALGVSINPHKAPALNHLLSRMGVDSGQVMGHAKLVYKRPRPFVELGGPICVARDDELSKSYSYPSGHSTYSWTAGLILAELAPDRSGEILARARVYGESRVVCGVHYASDVQAGRLAASALFGALNANATFEADLAQARTELEALRASPGAEPDAGECRIEADAEAHPAW